ncbi:AMP-binding protein [Roseicella frigidaeris]|nr:AMP-binding protein [Roseicella frigidaeris]
MAPEATLPLTDRRPDSVICRRDGRAITAGALFAAAAALARRLPADGGAEGPAEGPAAAPRAINVCAGRDRMLVGFVAALLRGHATLLNADPAPERLRALAERHPGAYVLADAPVAGDPGLPVLQVPAVAPEAAAPGPLPRIPARRVVAIGFTSGSTGAPTEHRKPWEALVAAAQAAAERFGLDDPAAPASLVATVPPQHMYGFETTIMLPLWAPVAIQAGASFFPNDVLDALEGVPAPRVLVTTPLHLRALLAEGRAPALLAAVISATAPLGPGLAEAVERDWGAPMLEIYGATEAGSMASRRSLHEPDWLPYRGVGIGPDSARIPGLGEVALADLLEPQPDGRVRLLGRRADVIKLGGRRASLADLNRRLLEVEGVVDGAFVAPEDLAADPAARLMAFAVAPGRSAEAILAALRRTVEPLFLPRPLLLVPALPRDRLGKLSHPALAAMRHAAQKGG